MKVPELLMALSVGELSNLALSQSNTIDESKIPKIIQSINDALLRLHTKFVLKEKSLIIEMRENMTFYTLKKQFAYSSYDINNPPSEWNRPYIMDNKDEPFLEDVIKVLSVFNYDGNKLAINDTENTQSVFTPQATTIQMPFPVAGKMLGVEYQAKHETIPMTGFDDIEVDLPEFLQASLRYFVASEVYSQMNTQENIVKGQEYLMKFEKACQEAIDMDLVTISSSTTNVRFEKRGWV